MRHALALAAALGCAGTDYPDPVVYDCTRTVTCAGTPTSTALDPLCAASADEAHRFACLGTETGCACSSDCAAAGACP